jgi:hypothetical protein
MDIIKTLNYAYGRKEKSYAIKSKKNATYFDMKSTFVRTQNMCVFLG